MQLPRTICSYQHLNYSILIDGDGKIFHHGPYHQYGSNPIRETIASGLEESGEYTLMVRIDTQAGVIHSQQYSFSKKEISCKSMHDFKQHQRTLMWIAWLITSYFWGRGEIW